MKHILNNLTDEEKNSIRSQHTGEIKVNTEKFSKLVNSKVGDVKPIVKEQVTGPTFSQVLVKCFQETFDNPNIRIPKSCEELAKEVLENKKFPSDMSKVSACASDLSKETGKDVFTTMLKLKDVADCIVKKAGSPRKF